MKMLMIGLVTMFYISYASAAVDCTNEPKAKWKDEATFKKELEATYKIKNFKVTSGNCYEIYGWDKANKKVEIYFNPVTGEKVKEKVEK
jgi:hypothetical protein